MSDAEVTTQEDHNPEQVSTVETESQEQQQRDEVKSEEENTVDATADENKDPKREKARSIRNIKEDPDDTKIWVFGFVYNGDKNDSRLVELSSKARRETLLGKLSLEDRASALVYLKNKIHIMGQIDNVWCTFDLEEKTFKTDELPKMPLLQTNYQAAASAEEIVVVGGYDSNNDGFQKTAAIYSSKTSKWDLLPNLKYTRFEHGLAWAPDIGLILVVGGNSTNGKSVEGMWRAWRSPDNEKPIPTEWMEFKDVPIVVEPYCMTYFRGSFVIAAGCSDHYSSGFVFSFKPPSSQQNMIDNQSRGDWCRLPNIYERIEFNSLVATRNRIYGFVNERCYRFRQVKEETTDKSRLYYRCWGWQLSKIMLNLEYASGAVAVNPEDM